MGIVEQAARRLEELRRSGIDVPNRAPALTPPTDVATANLPARVADRLDESRRTTMPPRATAQPAAVQGPFARIGSPKQSARVEIDFRRLGAMGFVTPEVPRSQIADEFRVIKRQLLANVRAEQAAATSRPANLVMVTSAVPNEGKTFVAINLAISLALELNKRALLVDADVSRPSVMRSLALEQSAGFLDVLANPPREMSSVLLRTNLETLSLLPAGEPRPFATEMLASEAATRLLVEMAERYPDRIIVFDAPPLLPSTESRVLATHMGQVILVVAAERTPQRTVMQALTTIEACPVVLPLLNKASFSEVSSYYGYYGPMER